MRLPGAAATIFAATACLASYPISTPEGSAVKLVCTALTAAFLWPHLGTGGLRRFAILMAGLAAALLGTDPWSAGIGVVVILAAACVRAPAPLRSMCSGSLLATGCLSLWLLFDATGFMWTWTSRLSWFITSRLSGLRGEAEPLAPNHTSLPLLAFATILWLAPLLPRPSHPAKQARLGVAILVAGVLCVTFRQPVLAYGAIALASLLGDWKERPRTPWHRTLAGAASTLFPLFLIILITVGAPSAIQPRRSIGIVDGGLKTLRLPGRDVAVSTPDQANFGTLPTLLPLYDWTVSALPPDFEAGAIADLGVLLVISPTRPFSSDQRHAIESFVRAGGRLLVLGDHTDIGGIMGPLNQLLSFTSIRFDFDSAIPMDMPNWRWQHCLRSAWHPAFYGKANESFHISVGASLTVGDGARTLVLGDRAFSDEGRPKNGESRLGDMRRQPEERMGGLPLVAEQAVGRGLVQVWGDTSGFQTTNVTWTGDQIVTTFETLVARDPSRFGNASVALALMGAACSGLFLMAGRTSALLACLAVGSLGCGQALKWCVAGRPSIPPRSFAQVAVFDRSHRPGYPTSDPQFSLYRLCELFIRRGDLLLATADFDSALASHPKSWVIVAPNQAYSRQEARRLADYVEQGGRLYVAAGYKHHDGVQPLLQEFSLDVDPSPYGAAHNSRITRPDWRAAITGDSIHPEPQDARADDPFRDPYDADIASRESHPIIGQGEPLLTCWGRPLVVAVRRGKGVFVLFADSRFLNNEALEIGSGPAAELNKKNAEFVLRCLEL